MLEYEIPKYDGDLGNPNLFVPLPAATCQRKVELLLEQFPSQLDHRWFSADTFEGFHCRKATLDLPGAAPQ